MKITYYGHATCSIELENGPKILIDPFFTDNPLTTVRNEDVHCDYILATHGHNDHIGDLIPIAKKENALVIAIAELATWASFQGVKAHGMNIGGSFQFPFGKVKMVFAQHSSSFTQGENIIYLGEAAGFLLEIEGKTLYFAGDTAYFSDMKLLAPFEIDLAFLPIGDNFTMGLKEAALCAKVIEAKKVVPIHYNTFPVIEQNPLQLKKYLPEEKIIVLNSGDTMTF